MPNFMHRADDARPFYEIAEEAGGVMLWRVIGRRDLYATEAEARESAGQCLTMPWWVFPGKAIFPEDAA